MIDLFQSTATGISGPANRHFAITPADEDLAIRPRAIYVSADGNVVIRDDEGPDITYAVTAGQIIPFRAVQIRAATTATVVGWY